MEQTELIPYTPDLLQNYVHVVEHTSILFDEWYAIYPRKRGKVEALKAWKRKSLDGIGYLIIADTKKRVEVEWKDPKFIPYASTYINQERWEDDIEPEPLAVPEDDDSLWRWATENNLPDPHDWETNRQYRQRLQGLVRQQAIS